MADAATTRTRHNSLPGRRPRTIGIAFMAAVCVLASACTTTSSGDPATDPSKVRQEREAAGTHIRSDRVQWLAGATLPIATAQFDGPTDDLAPIADSVADARLVGLGEPSHGNGDLVALRARLVRTLVEQHGFRYFVLEEDAGNMAVVNSWLASGDGSWQEATRGTLVYYWDDGYRQLFEWFRQWNEEHPGDAVTVWGNDTQQWEPLAEQISLISPELETELTAVTALAEQFSVLEGRRINTFGSPQEVKAAYAAIGLDADTIVAQTEELRPRYALAAEELVTAAAALRDPVLSYLVDSLRQFGEVSDPIFGYYFATGDFVKINQLMGLGAAFEARDRALARNVLTVGELLGPDAKGIYWGHNSHISKGFLEPGAPASGYHIAEEIGDGYVAVMGDFFNGSFSAGEETGDEAGTVGADGESVEPEDGQPDQVQPTDPVGRAFEKRGIVRGSLSAKLAQLDEPYLWLSLADRDPNDPDEVWLFDPMAHYNLGGTHSDDPSIVLVLGERKTEVLPDVFDAVLFTRTTTPLVLADGAGGFGQASAEPTVFEDPSGRVQATIPGGFTALDPGNGSHVWFDPNGRVIIIGTGPTGDDPLQVAADLLKAMNPQMADLAFAPAEAVVDSGGVDWTTGTTESDGSQVFSATREADGAVDIVVCADPNPDPASVRSLCESIVGSI